MHIDISSDLCYYLYIKDRFSLQIGVKIVYLRKETQMNILIYDNDHNRMLRNYTYFSGEKKLSFIAVNTAKQICDTAASADIAIIYFSEEEAEELLKTRGINLGKRAYLLCRKPDPTSCLVAFYLGAECISTLPEGAELYGFLRKVCGSMKHKSKNFGIYIDDIFRACAIPAHMTGRNYAKTAIEMCCINENMLYGITKILYLSVSKHYSVSPQSVEKAVRNVIEKSWSSENKGYREILNITKNKRPTNKEFIAAVVRFIKYMEEKGKMYK